MSDELSPPRRPRLFASLLFLIGLALAIQGTRLALLGGSVYYVVAGAAIAVAGALLWRGDRRGVWVYAVMLAGTVVWATVEAGFDGWALLPRLLAPAVLGVWFFTPSLRQKLSPGPSLPFSVLGMSIAVALLLIGVGLVPKTAPAKPLAPVAAKAPGSGDWLYYGNDPGGSRFSPLAQLTPKNVDGLKLAWTYRTGAPKARVLASLQVTPLKVDDTVYLCTGVNDIVALDAETGHVRWRFDAKLDAAGLFASTCRGVAYFRKPVTDGIAAGACAERVLTATTDARMIAVDARTGEPCADFGTNGQIDLTEGMGEFEKGYYNITSPPTIVRGVAVVGGQVTDGQHVGEPSGVVRAFDAVTGRFAWAWDIGRPGVNTPPGPGEHYTRGTPNSWAPMSADEALGLVYVPTGNATPDYYGGHRTHLDDQYSSSVVALDAQSGAPIWSFQTTHHDLWDYDVPSQPTLFDLPTVDGPVPALAQATKRGEVFILDRRTGKPLLEVDERPVPPSTVPDERASPTQPFSVGFPSFAGPAPTEATMWGVTPFDQLWCRIKFREARFEGTLTPLGLDRPTIVYPGYLGGMDWGSVAVDHDRELMIVNSNRVVNYNRLLTRKEADERGLAPISLKNPGYPGGAVAQLGTPYGADIKPFLSPIAVPCTQPPFGMISAVDLKTRQVVWTKPFGTARGSGLIGIPSHLPLPMGVPNLGGAVATRGGVFFIGASQDSYFRAYETSTGRELWRHLLPAGGQATPMTYWSNRSGRQFVVIAAGGHGGLLTPAGDYILAFALPTSRAATVNSDKN
jgi:quinoprotein glucose dehydrogenase